MGNICRKPHEENENEQQNEGTKTNGHLSAEPIKSKEIQQNGRQEPPRKLSDIEPSVEGEQYLVLYHYEAETHEEISIKVDDVVNILSKEGNWWKASINGKVGYIPSNYVAEMESLNSFQWYHDNISRQESIDLLAIPDLKMGTFLIRESNKGNGHTHTLCYIKMVDGNVVPNHVKIFTYDDDTVGIERCKEHFSNLFLFVQACQKKSNPLLPNLTDPCPREKPEPKSIIPNQWVFPSRQFERLNKLGEGSFSTVYSGRWVNKQREVAIKVMKPGTMDPEKFLEEANVMRTLQHKHVIDLLAVCTDGDNGEIFIVMEVMKNGALLSYIKSKENLRNFELLYMALQICNAMRYMEKENYVHSDLAARNVLVGPKNTIKVSDFGLTKILGEQVYMQFTGTKCPVKWTALEALLYQKYSTKSDVWSFGVVLHEIVSKGDTQLYKGILKKDLISYLQNGGRIEKHANCPDDLYAIMLECWRENRDDRPSFKEIYPRLEAIQTNLPGNTRSYEDQSHRNFNGVPPPPF